MILPISTLVLATHLTFTIAESVPRFNVDPLCRGIAQQGGLDLEPSETLRQSIESCVTGEMAVRRKLVDEWSSFEASDKENCAEEPTSGGLPSYTELLTCLEMARETRQLSEQNQALAGTKISDLVVATRCCAALEHFSPFLRGGAARVDRPDRAG